MNRSTIVVRQLRQRALRNLASLFSIALAASLVTLFIAGRSFFAFVDKLTDLPQVVVGPLFPFSGNLLDRDTQKLKALPNLVAVTRAFTVVGMSKDKRHSFSLSGVDETYFTVVHKTTGWFPTTPEMVERWNRERTGFIVGEETARRLGIEEGHQYVLDTNHGQISGIAVGIASGGTNKTNAEFHYEYVDEVLGGHKGFITIWMLDLKDQKDVQPTIATIDAMFKETGSPTTSTPAADHVRTITSNKRGVVGLLGVICALTLFVTLFVTMSTVLLLVRERRSMLATLRAIGFRQQSVVSMIVVEVMALCVAGGVLGVTIVVTAFRHGIPIGTSYLSAVTIHGDAIVLGLGVSVAIGIIASVGPALIASRTNIVDALRSN